MPRFNFRLLIGIGLIFFGVIGLIAIIMFMAVRFRGGEPQAPGGAGGVGALPGVGEGPGGSVREGGEGGLPSAEGEIPIPETQFPIGPGIEAPGIDAVARGGRTEAQAILRGFPVSVDVSSAGGLRYYHAGERKFYRVTADGTSRLLSDEEFPGIVEAVWSPVKDSAVLAYADGSNVYYDFTTKRMAVLPKDMADPAFRADGEAIAYRLETGDARNNWLMVSLVDGSGVRPVQAVADKGEQVQVAWSPDNKIAALYRQPRGIDREEIFFIGLEGENFISLEVQGSSFEGMWSPNGRTILYHTVLAGDEYRPNIWVAEAGAGGERRTQSLGLRTWVDRCAFSPDSRVAYCAVPQDLPAGAGIVRQVARNIAYDVWSVDLLSGIARLVANPVAGGGEVRDVRKVHMAPDGSVLFLETLGSVYRIRLR